MDANQQAIVDRLRAYKRFDFDVNELVSVCATCGKEYRPGYAFKTRRYCSQLCSRTDPAKAAQRLDVVKLAARAAAIARTANARVQYCTVCEAKLRVADPRTKTCGATMCRSVMRGRKVPKTIEQKLDERRYMVRRYAGRKDQNHQTIVDALEAGGCAIIDMASHGGGFPDLIVCRRGVTYLVEIKNLENSYGKKGANKYQKAWAARWPMPVWILATLEDVEAFLNGQFKKLKMYGGSDEAVRAVLGEGVMA